MRTLLGIGAGCGGCVTRWLRASRLSFRPSRLATLTLYWPIALIALGCLGNSTSAHAQGPVVSPTTSSFTQPSIEIPATLSIHFDVFACQSVSAGGACVNPSTTAVGAGVDIPAASVTTLTTPDSFGNNRSIAINVPPVSTFLAANLSAGVAYVATVQALGDATLGSTTSGRSAASNPFFSALRPLTAPGNHKVK